MLGHRRSLSSTVSDWITIIGLEIHAQLATKHKLFSDGLNCQDSVANSLVRSFDVAVPGYLPVLNPECLDLALRAALLLDCEVRPKFSFDRKHYAYPDLPHGYQITQYYEPYAVNGRLQVKDKIYPIEKIQIEMDSGKSYESASGKYMVDMNRAGIGLLELVTAPIFRSSQEAISFLKALHSLLKHAGVCTGGMESGHFRVDLNVSVAGTKAPQEAGPLGIRVEIKNLNSFAALAQAIEHESKRQVGLLEQGILPRKETRGFNSVSKETYKLRSKEEQPDYRFIRDYDIPDIHITSDHLQRIKFDTPITMEQKCAILMKESGLERSQVELLMEHDSLLSLFQSIMRSSSYRPEFLYHWVTIDYLGLLHKLKLNDRIEHVDHGKLAEFLKLIVDGKISRNSGKEVLSELLIGSPKSPSIIASDLNLLISSNDDLNGLIETACRKALDEEPVKAREAASGKRSLDYFMGPLMKQFKGKIQPKDLRLILSDQLASKYK